MEVLINLIIIQLSQCILNKHEYTLNVYTLNLSVIPQWGWKKHVHTF